ncbi:hypothetical protein AVEN_150619-1, partial [Araneus ventricosus]
MTTSLKACVKRKHSRNSDLLSKCPLKSEWTIILLCPHLNELTTCAGKIPSLWDSEICHMPPQGTVD